MTLEEAIEQLESLILNSQSFHEEEGDIWEKDIEALNMAISALEKQMPKKPIIKPWSPAICPSCGEELSISLGDGYYRHRINLTCCPNLECLQRLDWGEEE